MNSEECLVLRNFDLDLRRKNKKMEDLFSIIEEKACEYDASRVYIDWESYGYYSAKTCGDSLKHHIRVKNLPYRVHVTKKGLYVDLPQEEESK